MPDQKLYENIYPEKSGCPVDCDATYRRYYVNIPDDVTGVFHWYNPSSRTLALGSTQPLNRNEYQEYFLGGKGGRCVGLTTLPPSCADCLEIWET